MMRVELGPEPGTFDGKVRKPGLSAIAELVGESPLPGEERLDPRKTYPDRESIPGGRFPSHWRRARGDLLREYEWTCAFSGLRIEPSVSETPTPIEIDVRDRRLTIDHMVPKSKDWRLVYEWDNLRLACAVLNRRKGSSEDVLDPFQIDIDGETWFHMEIVGFRLLPNVRLATELQERVKATIDILDLNGPSWRATRGVHFERFQRRGQLGEVARACPYVAREIGRQGIEPNPRSG